MDSFMSWQRSGDSRFVDLNRLARSYPEIEAMPVSRLLILEFLLRCEGQFGVTKEHIAGLLGDSLNSQVSEMLFRPARLIMQDYAGLAALVDIAALRDAAKRDGFPAEAVQFSLPVDLVVDHSLITHHSGGPNSAALNLDREYSDNQERYAFLKWAETAFEDLNVVPPGQGIVHQLNIEKFSTPLKKISVGSDTWIAPDSVLGTDSHTTMVNGLGILGWGVGGIEATSVVLGEAIDFRLPQCIGIKLDGALPNGAFATDVALRLTERLRGEGVVGAHLEFFGPGADHLSAEDRTTIANMCPEFGATSALFPFDGQTLQFYNRHGQASEVLEAASAHLKKHGLNAEQSRRARFDQTIDFDLGRCQSVVAGPFGPAQKQELSEVGSSFKREFVPQGQDAEPTAGLVDGDIVLAAITSCTNTANTKSMIAAGLLARKAVQLGLKIAPHIKCTMVLGSRKIAAHLKALGFDSDFAALGFHIDGFGCGACVGNSGDLNDLAREMMEEWNGAVASVLSGNRNFPGRIHRDIKANYLMSPAMVLAYALLGNVREDISTTVIGQTAKLRSVFLSDLWPSNDLIDETLVKVNRPSSDKGQLKEDDQWVELASQSGATFSWSADSSYLIEPPFLQLKAPQASDEVLDNAAPLVVLADNVTTDHISPAGKIDALSDAALFLRSEGVSERDFNAYGARRGNHHVMMRGTFANANLPFRFEAENPLRMPGTSVFQRAQHLAETGQKMIVCGGKNYGAGSARDWAAKGTRLLGVSAVIAESFERIHRSNLVRCGVLPIECEIPWAEFNSPEDLFFSLPSQSCELTVSQHVNLEVHSADGDLIHVPALIRLDTPNEVAIYRAGGTLRLIHTSLKQHFSEVKKSKETVEL